MIAQYMLLIIHIIASIYFVFIYTVYWDRRADIVCRNIPGYPGTLIRLPKPSRSVPWYDAEIFSAAGEISKSTQVHFFGGDMGFDWIDTFSFSPSNIIWIFWHQYRHQCEDLNSKCNQWFNKISYTSFSVVYLA